MCEVCAAGEKTGMERDTAKLPLFRLSPPCSSHTNNHLIFQIIKYERRFPFQLLFSHTRAGNPIKTFPTSIFVCVFPVASACIHSSRVHLIVILDSPGSHSNAPDYNDFIWYSCRDCRYFSQTFHFHLALIIGHLE